MELQTKNTYLPWIFKKISGEAILHIPSVPKAKWFWYALLCIACWGAWTLFAKLGSGIIPAATMEFLFPSGCLPLTIVLLAVAGEVSWLNLVLLKAIFLIPLVRFPGFIWLMPPDSRCRGPLEGRHNLR